MDRYLGCGLDWVGGGAERGEVGWDETGWNGMGWDEKGQGG